MKSGLFDKPVAPARSVAPKILALLRLLLALNGHWWFLWLIVAHRCSGRFLAVPGSCKWLLLALAGHWRLQVALVDTCWPLVVPGGTRWRQVLQVAFGCFWRQQTHFNVICVISHVLLQIHA